MKYLTLFKSHDDYDNFYESDNILEPNVSYDGEHVHFSVNGEEPTSLTDIIL